jgi:Co/Zn/Cd efflux system component
MSSILLLWLLTGILVYMATERIIRDEYNINATVMLTVAGLGVAFNLL